MHDKTVCATPGVSQRRSVSPLRTVPPIRSALTGFEPRVLFVDHIHPAASAYELRTGLVLQ